MLPSTAARSPNKLPRKVPRTWRGGLRLRAVFVSRADGPPSGVVAILCLDGRPVLFLSFHGFTDELQLKRRLPGQLFGLDSPCQRHVKFCAVDRFILPH